MKKLLSLLVIILVIGLVDAAAGGGENQGQNSLTLLITPDTESNITIGEGVVFTSQIVNGVPPYNVYWSFCAECVPQDHTCNGCFPGWDSINPPTDVVFNHIGEHVISLSVEDSSEPVQSELVTYTINVNTVEIDFPGDRTGWAAGELTTFRAVSFHLSDSPTYDYTWDFGDGSAPVEDQGLTEGEFSIVTHTYPVTGEQTQPYEVTVSVVDSLGNSDSDTITIYAIEPIPLNFSCSVRGSACNVDDIELLRFYRPLNSHVIGFDDPDASLYDYSLCCRAASLIPTSSPVAPEGNLFIYAELQTDADAISLPNPPAIGGGSHTTTVAGAKQYYSLVSYLGAAGRCFTIDSGKCEDQGAQYACLYEFYPEEGKVTGSHLANCTAVGEPDNYPSKMCCGINEDCTNNIDDDLNSWTDCSDFGVCNIQICGVSNPEQYVECGWMTNYAVGDGYDFTSFTELEIQNILFENRFCYKDAYPNYPDCDICLFDGVLQHHFALDPSDCPASSPTLDNLSLPTELSNYPTYNPAELYGACAGFHCSDGQNPQSDPLPAYVENMMQNYNDTKHCCPSGTYWDPETGLCEDFSECYAPYSGDGANPYTCEYDFKTEFDAWIANYYEIIANVEDLFELDMDDVIINCKALYVGNSQTDQDFNIELCDIINTEIEDQTNCFDLVTVMTGLNPECCCPIWQHGENTYAYTDVEYYQSS